MFLRKNEPYIALNCISGNLKFKIFWGRAHEPPASLVSRAVPLPELSPKQKFLDRTLRTHVCTHTFIHTHVHTCIHTHHTHTHTHTHTHIHMYALTHSYTHMCTHAYTHTTHTHAPNSNLSGLYIYYI